MVSRQSLYILFSLTITWSPLALGQMDSLHLLTPIIVEEKALISPKNTSNPVYTLDQEQLERSNTTTLADAVKTLPGVYLKDFGGIGGLKTLSLRGLDAKYTRILIDGIPIIDAQMGQIDLSTYPVAQFSSMSLALLEPSGTLLPASAYNGVNFLSLQPSTSTPKNGLDLQFGVKMGSFGLFQPHLLIKNGWQHHQLGGFINYQSAHGVYPFTYQNGQLTSHDTRKNADQKALNALTNYQYKNNWLKSTWNLQLQSSNQGLPGAIILYQPNALGQRLYRQNWSIQTKNTAKLSPKWDAVIQYKWSENHLTYEDPTFLNEESMLRNTYQEQHHFTSLGLRYEPDTSFSVYFVGDLDYSQLITNVSQLETPRRYYWLQALRINWHNSRLHLQGGLLHHYLFDQNKSSAATRTQKWNANAGFNYQILKKQALFLKMMYKGLFRMPTFNELYYNLVENPNLKPEYSNQLDAGLFWEKRNWAGQEYVSVDAHVFYGQTRDKIITVPTQNLFIWSMQNIGTVENKGGQVAITSYFKMGKKAGFTTTTNYTFQRNIDRTDESKSTYGHQIPYTPQHLANLQVGYDRHKWSLTSNVLYNGARYRLPENSIGNYLPPWFTQDVIFLYKMWLNEIELRGRLALNNIWDHSYEVISYFPMPGFHGFLTLTIII